MMCSEIKIAHFIRFTIRIFLKFFNFPTKTNLSNFQLDLNEANKKLQSAQAAVQQNNVSKPIDDAQRKQIEAQLKQMEEVKKQLDGQAKAIESERKLFEEQRFVGVFFFVIHFLFNLVNFGYV